MTPHRVLEHITALSGPGGHGGRASAKVTALEAMDAAAEAFTAYPVSGDATTIWAAINPPRQMAARPE